MREISSFSRKDIRHTIVLLIRWNYLYFPKNMMYMTSNLPIKDPNNIQLAIHQAFKKVHTLVEVSQSRKIINKEHNNNLI